MVYFRFFLIVFFINISTVFSQYSNSIDVVDIKRIEFNKSLLSIRKNKVFGIYSHFYIECPKLNSKHFYYDLNVINFNMYFDVGIYGKAELQRELTLDYTISKNFNDNYFALNFLTKQIKNDFYKSKIFILPEISYLKGYNHKYLFGFSFTTPVQFKNHNYLLINSSNFSTQFYYLPDKSTVLFFHLIKKYQNNASVIIGLNYTINQKIKMNIVLSNNPSSMGIGIKYNLSENVAMINYISKVYCFLTNNFQSIQIQY